MEETALLKSEIERLNKIINILVDQNVALKAENANLKQYFSAKSPINSVADLGNGIKGVLNTNADLVIGIKDGGNTIAEKDKGITDSRSTIEEKGNGTNEFINSNDVFGNGIKDVGTTIAENIIGINSKTTAANITVPPTIENGGSNVWNLALALKPYFYATTKRGKLLSLAQQLLFLHNNGHATSGELRKASGLSKPGYAKHAPDIRRKNFIYRHSFKKYMLTDFSKELIKKVFGVNK